MVNSSLQMAAEIVHLNEMGAFFLGVDRDEEALRHFRQALVKLEQADENFPNGHHHHHEEGANRRSDAQPTSVQIRMIRSVRVSGLCDDRFCIFSDALVLAFLRCDSSRGTGHAQISLSQRDMCLCTSVALFNSALLFHKQAKNTGSSKLFDRACRIYHRAWTMAQEIDVKAVEEDAAHSNAVTRLKIVILNNLAQIYYLELANYNRARSCLEPMKHLIFALPRPDAAYFSSYTALAFHNMIMDELYLNLILNKTPTGAQSA